MKEKFSIRNSIKLTLALLLAAVVLAFVLSGSFLQFNGIPGATPTGGEISATGTPGPTATAVPEPYPVPQKLLSLSLPDGLQVPAVASGEYFYLQNGQQWQCTFLKGVNMGLSLPTTDLADPDISYETYMEWFAQIAAMNANTIKVFTIMNPDFYNALYAYNSQHKENPLYLLHGLWFNEDYMVSIGDAFGEKGKILQSLQRSAREAVDIIHGNSDYTSYGSVSPAVYDKDISPYVVGWILGLEWASEFVQTTNQNNKNETSFQGDYLYIDNAQPFESFLAQAGDYAIAYETENYAAQRPVAFLNWQSTDPLEQSNEPFAEEDMVQVRTESIKATGEYYAGLFAALDIYPYYPEFMNYQPEYLAVKDADGTVNTYRGYLRALKEYYTVPVVVAEVGLSTSRGIAHSSVMGYDQGGLEETQQGEMVLKMIQDIAREAYAGAMIFSWQDEWFKQTWNTYKYYPADPAARTPNAQSAEQHYGILAYEPGALSPACYPDGDIAEWKESTPVFSSSEVTLYINYDEEYLYIMGQTAAGFDLQKDTLLLPVSLTGRGNSSSAAYDVQFSQNADFLLVLAGQESTRLLVDASYDYFYYEYTVRRKIFQRNKSYEKHDSGIFNPIRMFTSNEIVLPQSGETISPASYEAGLLHYGNANPDSGQYSSLADFCFGEHTFEVRIPWYLLNVLSPAESVCMGDFYGGKAGAAVKTQSFGSLYIGVGTQGQQAPIQLSAFDIEAWGQSTYHARLKKSYDILQKGLADVMPDYE